MAYNLNYLFSFFKKETSVKSAFSKEFEEEIKQYIGWGSPDFIALIEPRNPRFFVGEKNIRLDFGKEKVSTLNIFGHLVPEQVESVYQVDLLTMDFVRNHIKNPRSIILRLNCNIKFPNTGLRRIVRDIRVLSFDQDGVPNLGIMGITDVTEIDTIVPPTFRIILNNENSISQYIIDKYENKVNCILNSSLQTRLTKRETQILQRVSIGNTSSEIADALGITKGTVDKHRQNMIKKFDVPNSASLMQKLKFKQSNET